MKRVAEILGVLFFLAACSQKEPAGSTRLLPYYNHSGFTPEWIQPTRTSCAHSIAFFSFTNQHGEIISQQTTSGKIYVASFFFTSCPGICKNLTQNMRKVQQAYKQDPEVLLLSHTVTPETDSVPVLKRYADRFGMVRGKWHLLTGGRDEIYTIARTSYFADEDLGKQQGEDDFLHTENLLLIDKHNHIRGVYKGTSLESINNLIADIKELKKEG